MKVSSSLATFCYVKISSCEKEDLIAAIEKVISHREFDYNQIYIFGAENEKANSSLLTRSAIEVNVNLLLVRFKPKRELIYGIYDTKAAEMSDRIYQNSKPQDSLIASFFNSENYNTSKFNFFNALL